jgi:hypothetical protein
VPAADALDRAAAGRRRAAAPARAGARAAPAGRLRPAPPGDGVPRLHGARRPRDLHLPAEPEESPSFRGLVAEREQLVGRVAEDDHLLRDLAHAVAALATEHLELATYESLVSLAESLGEEEAGIRLRDVLEQEEIALEQVESALAKLLAEQVESPRL